MPDFLILDSNKKDSVYNVNNKNSSNFRDRFNDLIYSFQKVKVKDKVTFFRLLSTMINA
jgi:hypothetical protein